MTLVTPSKWLADQVKESFLKEYDVHVFPNGIDLNVFGPTESNFRKKHALEGKQIILGVANVWDDRKGLRDFVELSAMLQEHQKIVLVGLSQEQIKDLPGNILGIQRTNSIQELAKIYSAADVYVNPSREETQGLTTVEALACGTPVIVYGETAVPETVTPLCGEVVSSSPIDIYQALQNAWRAKENCIEQAGKYDKNLRYEQYLECYLSVIGR